MLHRSIFKRKKSKAAKLYTRRDKIWRRWDNRYVLLLPYYYVRQLILVALVAWELKKHCNHQPALIPSLWVILTITKTVVATQGKKYPENTFKLNSILYFPFSESKLQSPDINVLIGFMLVGRVILDHLIYSRK